MKAKSKIAVVIPTVNRKETLRHCLESLKNQTYKDFEIYVVNNGSTDGTQEMLEKDFPKIHALNFKEMLGSAGGYKKGLEKAFSDGAGWFWLMDDDVWTQTDALEILVANSRQDETKAFASVGMDEEKTGDLAWSNDLLKNNGEKINVTSYRELGKEDLVESAGIGYLGLFIPRKVITKIGYPDDKMFAWVDDIDYYLRIKKAGFRMFYVRKSLVFHPKAQYQAINILVKTIYMARSAPWKEYYSIRNSVYVWLKYDSKVKTYLFKIPKQILLYFIVWLFYSDKKIERLKYYYLGFYHGMTAKMGFTVSP